MSLTFSFHTPLCYLPGSVLRQMTQQLWTELLELFQSEQPLRRKYSQLYAMLDRVCIELTRSMPVNYNGLFTRLQVLCRLKNYPLSSVDVMRWRSREVKQGRHEPQQQEWLMDVKAFSDALARLMDSSIPQQLRALLPDRVSTSPIAAARLRRAKRQRFVAVAKDRQFLYARCADCPSDDPVRIDCALNEHTMSALSLVETDMQFNAVSFTVDSDGIIYPELLVIEPDCLLDVSALTACVKQYGASPYEYFLKKFEKRADGKHILLGHVANAFLDECVNHPDADFDSSLKHVFREHLLSFTTADGIDASFFEECRRQFEHIRQTIQVLRSQYGAGDKTPLFLLEPSFFCEVLGLQGRFDLLADDYSLLLELKSGKWDEQHKCEQREHLLQMLLYKEILYYNLNVRRSEVSGQLFYSRYPYLLEQRSAQQIVQELMTLRNQIVLLERYLCAGKSSRLILQLNADKFLKNKNVGERFWMNYCKPRIEAILHPLQQMDALTADYFHAFLQFVEREQMMSKVGDRRIESTRGMASLWNSDTDLKRENGDILTDVSVVDLRMDGELVEAVCFATMSDDVGAQPNFRVNDAVIFYRRISDADNATNQQVYRCAVERYDEGRIWLLLRNKQRLSAIDAARCAHDPTLGREVLFAIEHDYIDSTFRSLYSGLFSLVVAPPRRRDLLLCQREPSTEDFQLIVGPPGTGKTSVALRSMVAQYHGEGKQLLLMAYTNRAVDEICEMLETLDTDYIRLGKMLACDPKYHYRLLDRATADCVRRSDVARRLTDCSIFVSTVSSMSSGDLLFQIKQFDVAIFDEASQILEPQILGLLCAVGSNGEPAIRKFIMIGDHKQLPAVVVQEEEETEVKSELLRNIGLKRTSDSLFQRLYRWVEHRPGFVQLLDHQGRMHTDIARFSSQAFYGGKILPVPLEHQEGALPSLSYTADDAFVATHRVGFIDVPLPSPAERQPKMNVAEAVCIASLVKSLQHLHESNHVTFIVSAEIGIIVPFRRQIAVVRNALYKAGVDGAAEVLIDTVERYQGSQKNIIIYGTTITRPYELDILSNLVDVDGVCVDRKLNVAVTRARKQLFVVGNAALLQQNPLYRRLIAYIEGVDPDGVAAQ